MKTEYLEMPIDLLNQLGENVKFTKAVSFAHPVANSGGHILHHCTMYAGKRYVTTLEQKQEAEKLHKINKQRFIENMGNKLVFVAMGSDYTARYENDPCNYRIRTEIENPDGRRFFIEVGRGQGEMMCIDFVIDRDQESEYEKEAQRLRKIIQESKMVFVTHPLYADYQKYTGQPYYWFKKDQWNGLKTKYTNANILKLVNDLFECHFSELVVDCDHLTTDDYASKSPILEVA